MIKNTSIAALLISLTTVSGVAQIADCTDPQATNYNAAATINNGSCIYPLTNYSPVLIANLASTLNESSGLTVINGELWSHNDSGNPNQIHRINTTNGTVTQTIVIANVVNTDWESITQNSHYLFVGDFGNNNGNRTNLSILKIALDEIVNATNDTVQAEVIHFSYADQSSFTTLLNNNNFDCEAFFYSNDSLHLFSKNWANLQTKHYVLPATTGTHQAVAVDSFNVDGLITDAAINTEGTITLLGYKNNGNNLYTCFIWLLYDYPLLYNCFGGNKRRIEIGSALTLGQTEGITLLDNHTGYITSEQITAGNFSFPPKLHSFNVGGYISENTTAVKPINFAENTINIYPNRFTDSLTITNSNSAQPTEYKLTDAQGRVVVQGTLSSEKTTIDTRTFNSGFYFFHANGNTLKLQK